MAKLKEQDRRPVHLFKIGDIVRIRPGKVQAPLDNGIIFEIQDYQETKDGKQYQSCHVLFAPRQVDVWIRAKALAASKVISAKRREYESYIISNANLIYIVSKPDWMKPPSTEDLRKIRYMKVLDDLPGS